MFGLVCIHATMHCFIACRSFWVWIPEFKFDLNVFVLFKKMQSHFFFLSLFSAQKAQHFFSLSVSLFFPAGPWTPTDSSLPLSPRSALFRSQALDQESTAQICSSSSQQRAYWLTVAVLQKSPLVFLNQLAVYRSWKVIRFKAFYFCFSPYTFTILNPLSQSCNFAG